MKLSEVKPYLESSGELEEKSFAIQDQGMLFEILRKKMYSNPILAICREISCNARDAHREVGTPEAPIQITLPTNLDPFYKIKDFGPGISPDRMYNVFIKYTASTKREDNVQTGGFGLGAKTPFSYSDTFTIITVHNGVRYNYTCVIDETKVGKILLTNQSPTKEKNGTEIVIPVIPKDFIDFTTFTEQACRHWDTKPTIKGGTIRWRDLNFIRKEKNWGIAQSDYERKGRLIIDAIEYPLDLAALRTFADTKLIDSALGNLVMYFEVGELSLSSSRESVYLDERTKKIIRERLEKIRNELRKEAHEKLAKSTSLWDANVYYNTKLAEGFNNIDFLGQLTWNNIPLLKNGFHPGTEMWTFTRGKFSRKYGTDPNKLSREASTRVHFHSDKTEIYFNDLTIKEPTPKHVKKAFDDDATLQRVYVISPSDKLDQETLTKTYHLDKMNMKFLSSITKATGRAYTPPAQRVLVFKFHLGSGNFRQCSYASLDEDKSKKILCFLQKDYRYEGRYAVLDKGSMDWSTIKTLMEKFPGHTFYGVDKGTSPDRIKQDFSDLTPVQEFLKENIVDNKAIDFLQIKYAQQYRYGVDEKFLRVHDKMKDLVKDPNSLYFKRAACHEEIKEICRKDASLLGIYEAANGEIKESQFRIFEQAHPHLDIEKLNKQFRKKYPLLFHIDSYNYQSMVEALADYINLIDKENANV